MTGMSRTGWPTASKPQTGNATNTVKKYSEANGSTDRAISLLVYGFSNNIFCDGCELIMFYRCLTGDAGTEVRRQR